MKAPHMPPTEGPGLFASTPKGSDLELDALALGKQLYEAFWQRQPGGASAPAFDGQSAAISDMWSGIAADALSLLAARKGQGEWRGIESAPKDGTAVLLLCDADVSVGAWDGKTWEGRCDGSAVIESQSDFGTDYRSLWPAHWMPLPPPPEQGE